MPTNANRAPDTVAQIVAEMQAQAGALAVVPSFVVQELALRLAVATCDAWIPASTKPPPQLVSDAMTIKPLLLSLPRYDHPQAGWYVGGLLQEWRVWGSPNEQHPTHWRPMPPKADA